MGIMGDILDVTANGGRDGIIVSAISRKANLSHYAVLDKCEKLIEAGLVESVKIDRNRVFQITEKGFRLFSGIQTIPTTSRKHESKVLIKCIHLSNQLN
jgi:hypothetical protein